MIIVIRYKHKVNFCQESVKTKVERILQKKESKKRNLRVFSVQVPFFVVGVNYILKALIKALGRVFGEIYTKLDGAIRRRNESDSGLTKEDEKGYGPKCWSGKGNFYLECRALTVGAFYRNGVAV